MLALECTPHRSGRRLAMASVAAAAAAPLGRQTTTSRGSSSEGCARGTTSGRHGPKIRRAASCLMGVPWLIAVEASRRGACSRCRPDTRIVGRPRCSISQRLVTPIRMAEGATPAHICSVVPDWQHPTSSSPTQLCTRRRCLTLEGGGEAFHLGQNATSYPCGVDEPIQRRRTCSATASTNPYGVVISDHVRLDFDGS